MGNCLRSLCGKFCMVFSTIVCANTHAHTHHKLFPFVKYGSSTAMQNVPTQNMDISWGGSVPYLLTRKQLISCLGVLHWRGWIMRHSKVLSRALFITILSPTEKNTNQQNISYKMWLMVTQGCYWRNKLRVYSERKYTGPWMWNILTSYMPSYYKNGKSGVMG